MTTTRTSRILTLLLAVPVLLSGAACGALPGSGGSSDGGGGRASGVAPDWYETVAEKVEAAKKDHHFGGPPYLDADEDCALTDEVRLGRKGDEGSDESFASGGADPGGDGGQYVCEFHDPAITLSVARFPSRSTLDEVADNVRAQDDPQNDQTDHTYTVGRRSILVKRTTYPTNDSHIDYTALYLDRQGRGAVLLQIETTDDMRKTYSARQAARDLGGLLSRS